MGIVSLLQSENNSFLYLILLKLFEMKVFLDISNTSERTHGYVKYIEKESVFKNRDCLMIMQLMEKRQQL